MNIKDFLLPLTLALLTTWGIQYYFLGGRDASSSQQQTGLQSGQSFVAPENQVAYKPLNHEIDFIDERHTRRTENTVIQTPLANYLFSNDGATLQRVDFKRNNDGIASSISTVFPKAESDKEGRAFMLALGEKTPYFYDLIEKKDLGNAIELTYSYMRPGSDANITKKYTVFKDSYKVLLDVSIEPQSSVKSVQPRLFFPAPLMPELGSNDLVNGIVGDAKKSVTKIPDNKINFNTGWFAPTIFGADNKYFIHALVADAQHFAQRAYYFSVDRNLFAVVEGPEIAAPATWNLAFYMGPKEEQALVAVDTHLEPLLDYSGWLGPIAKLALFLIKWFYQYLKNYGLAIIALTILLKLVMLPFTLSAEKGVKQRAEFQKKLQYIQNKYKHDKELLAHERTELMRKHGTQGLSGCLPLLIQIPLFFALNRVLSTAIEFHQASFAWIPDLSAKDPYYILPILIAITMLVQALTVDEQQRFGVMAMALVFGAFSANFAAGLALYIFVSTFLSVGQTIVQRYMKAA